MAFFFEEMLPHKLQDTARVHASSCARTGVYKVAVLVLLIVGI
jgi:hypothetical protein